MSEPDAPLADMTRPVLPPLRARQTAPAQRPPRVVPPPSEPAPIAAPAAASKGSTWKGTVLYDDAQRARAQELERNVVRMAGVRAPKGKRMEIILDLLDLAHERPDLQAELVARMQRRAAAEPS